MQLLTGATSLDILLLIFTVILFIGFMRICILSAFNDED